MSGKDKIKKIVNHGCGFVMIIFFFLAGLYGKPFLTLKIRPFMVLFALSLIYMIVNHEFYKSIHAKNLLARLWILFFIYANIYVIFSYTVFPDIFQYPFGYSANMIPRQCYFIYYGFFVGSMIYHFTYNNKTNIVGTKIFQLCLDYFVVYIAVRVVFDRIILKGSLYGNIFSLSYILVIIILTHTVAVFSTGRRTKGSLLGLLIFTVVYILWPVSGSMKLILLVYIIYFVSGKYLMSLFKFWPILIVLSTFIFTLIYQNLPTLHRLDGNSGVRARYWKSNMETIVKSGFFGVGFGTAYFERSVFRTLSWAGFGAGIDHPDVLALPGSRYVNSLFVVAQHNSFLNVYYRLGFIGFCMFLILNIGIVYRICFLYSDKYKDDQPVKNNLILILSAFLSCVFLITLNPGLESPLFLIPYLYTYAISFGYTSRLLFI